MLSLSSFPFHALITTVFEGFRMPDCFELSIRSVLESSIELKRFLIIERSLNPRLRVILLFIIYKHHYAFTIKHL